MTQKKAAPRAATLGAFALLKERAVSSAGREFMPKQKKKKPGRPPVEGARNVGKSIRVSDEVAEYLNEFGTGIVEDVIRKSKAFRAWKQLRLEQ